jgi:4-amino-4-deoxy-L-arabinose transferase-like glycosyltransferase
MKKIEVLFPLILLFAIYIRTYNISKIFSDHELMHGAYVVNEIIKHGIINYLTNFSHLLIYHGPLNYFLMLPSLYLLGATPLALKLPFVTLGVLSIVFLYLFMKNFYSVEDALLASFILTILPGHITLSVIPLQYIFTSFFVTLTLYLSYKYFKTNQRKYLFLLTPFLSFGILVRLSFLFFFLPFFVLGLLFKKNHIKNLFKKEKLTILISLFLFLLPTFPLFFQIENNIRALEINLKTRFPITPGGEDLRNVWKNIENGLLFLFPKFFQEILIEEIPFHFNQFFNFYSIFLFSSILFISRIILANIHYTPSSSIYKKFSFKFKPHIENTSKKDIFLFFCLILTLILTSTLAWTKFSREEYVVSSPLIAIITARGISQPIKLLFKNYKFYSILFFLFFVGILLLSFLPFFKSYLDRKVEPCAEYTFQLAKNINETNFSFVIGDHIVFTYALMWYGLPTIGKGIFTLERGEYVVDEKNLQSFINEKGILYVFKPIECKIDENWDGIDLRNKFERFIIENNKTFVKNEIKIEDVNFTLYQVI